MLEPEYLESETIINNRSAVMSLIDKITTYDEYLDSDEMARKRQILSVQKEEDED